MEENLAEKIARLNRATPARDMYDLRWVGRTLLRASLDVPLVRRLSVLKIWVDAYGVSAAEGTTWETRARERAVRPRALAATSNGSGVRRGGHRSAFLAPSSSRRPVPRRE
jgi:predicted nucleotidyltransferase component of viral defense system